MNHQIGSVRKMIAISASVALLVAGGCSSPAEKSTDEMTPPTTVEDTVWKSQTDALDKARQVEGVLQDSADKRRQQIEDAQAPDP